MEKKEGEYKEKFDRLDKDIEEIRTKDENNKKQMNIVTQKISKLVERIEDLEEREEVSNDINNNMQIREQRREEQIDWMVKEKEREKIKNNFTIKGLRGKQNMSKEEVEEWVSNKLNIKLKLKKVWVIKKRGEDYMIGASCENENEKKK